MEKLGFGLMRLPLLDPEDSSGIDLALMKQLVDAYLEAGGSYFDTAYPYHHGRSEEAFRETVVKRHSRSDFTITDKSPSWAITCTGDYRKFFDEQLQRCGVDWFDYYWLHTLGAANYATAEKYGGFDFLSRMKKEGLVRHIGFSYHDNAQLLDRILTEHPETEYVQLQINYADWDSESVQSRLCYETAERHGKSVIVMEPVKGGALAQVPPAVAELFHARHPDWSPAVWALRYAASLKNVVKVLSGMNTMQQVRENTEALRESVPFTEEDAETVSRAADIFNRMIAIPCTACHYCTDGCPQNIAIPEYFSLYNNQYRFGLVPGMRNYYNNLSLSHGKASDCIGCGQCESRCPQHIPVIEWLAKTAEVYESKR